MAGRFVGRWADRTASRRACKPYRILFCFIPVGSVFVYTILMRNAALFQVIYDAIPSDIVSSIRFVLGFLLPRSLFELDLIKDRLGENYYYTIFFSELSLTTSGVVTLAVTVSRSTLMNVDDKFSFIQFLIRVFIVLACLVFRPVSFSNPQLATNYVDKSGLFIIKEGVVIAAGYYQLALILTDAFGRVMRKPQATPRERKDKTRTLHENGSL